MPMPETVIQIQDVTKRYGTKTVLDKVRLEVFRGETLVILGGSGSGKSTLLRMMIGNEEADGGQILIDGRNLSTMDEKELTKYRNSIGVLFQSGALFNS